MHHEQVIHDQRIAASAGAGPGEVTATVGATPEDYGQHLGATVRFSNPPRSSKPVPAVHVSFDAEHHAFSVYKLDDGSIMIVPEYDVHVEQRGEHFFIKPGN